MQLRIPLRVLVMSTLLVTLGSSFDLARTPRMTLGTPVTVVLEVWTMQAMLLLSGARLVLAIIYVTLISLLSLRLSFATL